MPSKDRKFEPTVPPHAKEVEDAILATIMLEARGFDIAAELLTPECFYNSANKLIFESMMTLNKRGIQIDLVVLVEYLISNSLIDQCGGAYEVSKKTNNIAAAHGLDFKCRIVKEHFIRREVIRTNYESIAAAFDTTIDAFEMLDQAEARIFAISNKNLNQDYTTLNSEMVKTIRKLEDLRHSDQKITGVPTGFPLLDSITHGWQPTDLIILAARPSVGKSSFAARLARNAAMSEFKPTSVGFFSLEMSKQQLVQRILAAESETLLETIKTGRIDDKEMKRIYEKGVLPLENANIFFDDTGALTTAQFRSKARRMVSKNKVGLIIIDYLQLMRTSEKKNNREQEISAISQELKALAKELGIPIIALSQLSREIEKRAEKKPQLSDLRESGAIEQDADMVIGLYRPDKTDVDQDADLGNKILSTILKHRSGSLEDIVFEANLAIQKWEEVGLLGNNFSKPVQTLKPIKVGIDYSQPKSKDDDEDAPF